MAYYVLDENNNLIEVTDQVLTAVVEKVKCCVSGTEFNFAFITQAKYNELEAQGLINKATTYYFILDDTTLAEINAQLKTINTRLNDLAKTPITYIDVSLKNDGTVSTTFDLSRLKYNLANYAVRLMLADGESYELLNDISYKQYVDIQSNEYNEDIEVTITEYTFKNENHIIKGWYDDNGKTSALTYAANYVNKTVIYIKPNFKIFKYNYNTDSIYYTYTISDVEDAYYKLVFLFNNGSMYHNKVEIDLFSINSGIPYMANFEDTKAKFRILYNKETKTIEIELTSTTYTTDLYLSELYLIKIA